jgi:sulfate permease, SulP family
VTLPLFASFGGYRRSWLHGDLVDLYRAGTVSLLLLLLYRASRPHVAVLGEVPGARSQDADAARHPENRREPGVVVLRVEGGLFFANADAVRDTIRGHAAEPGTRAIVLDAETVPFVDVSAARMLGLLAADLHRQGVQLLFARDIGQVRDVLAREAVERPLVRTYPTVRDAVDAVRQAPTEP